MSVVYFNSNNIDIYPAAKRDKGTYTKSRVSTEDTVTQLNRQLTGRNSIITGLVLSTSDINTIDITAGSAVVFGHLVSIASNTSLTVGDSLLTHKYIYIQVIIPIFWETPQITTGSG